MLTYNHKFRKKNKIILLFIFNKSINTAELCLYSSFHNYRILFYYFQSERGLLHFLKLLAKNNDPVVHL